MNSGYGLGYKPHFFCTYIHGESAISGSNVPVTRSPGVYSRDGLIAISPIVFPLTAVIRFCIASKSSCRWYCLSKSRDFQRFTAAIRGRCAWNNKQCMLDKSLITRGWPQVYARRLKSVGSNQIRGFLDTFWANQLSLIWDFFRAFLIFSFRNCKGVPWNNAFWPWLTPFGPLLW